MKLPVLLIAGSLAAALAAFSFAAEEPVVVEPSTPAPSGYPGVDPFNPWKRPAGPVRIAIQAGHWRAREAPDEQAGLRDNGTRWGGRYEWQVNLAIAERAVALLQQRGYEVDLLPTTIPPGYLADLFISIHADGSGSSSTSGFRAASPGRDATGRAHEFVDVLERAYGEATGLPHYPEVTRRMRYYYAFNWRRYQHSLHPMTTAVILETGFLTSPRDRRVIVDDPDRAARGIAEAAHIYLETRGLAPGMVTTAPSPPHRELRGYSDR